MRAQRSRTPGAAPAGVTAAAVGPSLPPSVAQRASLIQGPRGVAPTAPGQVLPGTGATIVPGQPRPGLNALGQPVPQPTLQPAARGKPSTGPPGAGGQRMPTSTSAAPAQGNQAQPRWGRNAKPGYGQPPSSSASVVPGQSASPGAQPSAPGAPRSTQPSGSTQGAIPARSNKSLAVRPPPGQRPSQPVAPSPQAVMHPTKPPPQPARPPASAPQAMRPPSSLSDSTCIKSPTH
jgi:hypothetical protein